MGRVFVFGCFYNGCGTRTSRVSREFNFGDQMIYSSVRDYFVGKGFEVDRVLPGEKALIESLAPDDCLIFSGGLFHPNILDVASFKRSKARKFVLSVGANWTLTQEHPGLLKSAQEMRDMSEFFCVRDQFTANWVGGKGISVFPCVTCVNADTEAVRGSDGIAIITSGPTEGRTKEGKHILFAGGNCVRSLDEIRKFSHFVTGQYHGIILPLCVGASVEAKLVNIKQQAFLDSFGSKIDFKVERRDGTKWALVDSWDAAWFKAEAEKSLDRCYEVILRN